MTDSPFSSLYVFFGPYSSPFQSIKKRSRAYTPALTYVKIPCKSAGVFRLEHTSCQALWVEPQYLTIWQKSILTCNAISVEFVIALWNSPVSWEQKSLQKHKLSWDRHEPKLWSQDSESPEHSTLPQNSLQLWFWNHKAEGGKKYFGGQKGSLWCFPFDGLPALWYTSWERPQGYREHKLKESTGISWILHRSRSFDTWLSCTRPSILCTAPCRVEYAICMIIVIIITSSRTTFSALWSRRRRGIRGPGIQADEGMEGGEEKVWGISFNPFAAGFQFLTTECISGLYSEGFSDKLPRNLHFISASRWCLGKTLMVQVSIYYSWLSYVIQSSENSSLLWEAW